MLKKLENYLYFSQKISAENDVNFFDTLFRIIFCRLYAQIGPEYYNVFSFYRKNFKEWKNYISKHDMDKLQEGVNPEKERSSANDKIIFYEKCKELGISTPEVLAIMGDYPDSKYIKKTIKTENQLLEFLKENKGRELIFKQHDGSYGGNILAIKYDGREVINLGKSEVIKSEELFNFYHHRNKVVIVQDKLKLNSDLLKFAPNGSLATIRVVTFVEKDNKIIIPYSYIRFPCGKNIHDNFSHGSSGNLIVNISVENGELGDAYSSEEGKIKIRKYSDHPETKEKFKGFVVPCWDEILTMARDAALKFLPLRTLGWDVALTDSGIYMVETNWHYDPDTHQVAMDRGIRGEIEEILKT